MHEKGMSAKLETSNMKNIVVLKNLPSNLVDEAIVILKSNKNAKKLEHIDKNSMSSFNEKKNTKDYVIREAESVISNYISKIEKNKTIKKSNTNIEQKYKRLKAYSIFASIIMFFSIIKTFI